MPNFLSSNRSIETNLLNTIGSPCGESVVCEKLTRKDVMSVASIAAAGVYQNLVVRTVPPIRGVDLGLNWAAVSDIARFLTREKAVENAGETQEDNWCIPWQLRSIGSTRSGNVNRALQRRRGEVFEEILHRPLGFFDAHDRYSALQRPSPRTTSESRIGGFVFGAVG